MNRRNGMWITIICILAVGISVTAMTKKLVASEETETFAAQMKAKSAAVSDPGPGMLKAAGFGAAEAETEMKAEHTEEETEPETVKSPLDPAVETEVNVAFDLEADEIQGSYTLEDLTVRLEKAGEKASQCQKNVSEASPVSAYAMAEQERLIWDKELNIIYTSIKGCMTEEEAESLKRSELEWIKERDLAADKAASRNMLSQNQNPDSARVLAEKTKERCYELLRDYEDILSRQETGE